MIKPDHLKAAYDAIRSMLDLLEKDGPLPSLFLDDPFVPGFIFYGIYGIRAVAVRAGAKPGDFEDMPAVYLALVEGDGPDVFRQSVKYSVEKNADFQRGIEAGDKLLAVTYSSPAYEGDQAVIHARAQASATMERLIGDQETAR
jgi:hypothetical protein